MAITDKQRMEFLERQGFTRWVGHGTKDDHTAWPVFQGDSFRRNVDLAIDCERRALQRKRTK